MIGCSVANFLVAVHQQNCHTTCVRRKWQPLFVAAQASVLMPAWRAPRMVMLENHLDLVMRLHTPLPPGKIGLASQPGTVGNESAFGPNAGETEVLIPAGYVTTVYDPSFQLSADKKDYVSVTNNTPTTLPAPGLPFSLVFRAEPGREDAILKVASAYQAASKRRVPPPAFGPLPAPGSAPSQPSTQSAQR